MQRFDSGLRLNAHSHVLRLVQCSLALYRQLRIGNVGAARLRVNLLAR